MFDATVFDANVFDARTGAIGHCFLRACRTRPASLSSLDARGRRSPPLSPCRRRVSGERVSGEGGGGGECWGRSASVWPGGGEGFWFWDFGGRIHFFVFPLLLPLLPLLLLLRLTKVLPSLPPSFPLSSLEHIVFDKEASPHISFATLPDMFSRTLTMSSAGKTFSTTGWKVGWAIGPPDLVKKMSDLQQFVCFSAPSVTQEAIARALEVARSPYAEGEGGDNFYEWLAGDYLRKRDFLCKTLREVGLTPIVPPGGKKRGRREKEERGGKKEGGRKRRKGDRLCQSARGSKSRRRRPSFPSPRRNKTSLPNSALAGRAKAQALSPFPGGLFECPPLPPIERSEAFGTICFSSTRLEFKRSILEACPRKRRSHVLFFRSISPTFP